MLVAAAPAAARPSCLAVAPPIDRRASCVAIVRPGKFVRFTRRRSHHGMSGVITGKDVIRHSMLICRLWGVRTYFRCLRAALSTAPSTFLEVVSA